MFFYFMWFRLNTNQSFEYSYFVLNSDAHKENDDADMPWDSSWADISPDTVASAVSTPRAVEHAAASRGSSGSAAVSVPVSSGARNPVLNDDVIAARKVQARAFDKLVQEKAKNNSSLDCIGPKRTHSAPEAHPGKRVRGQTRAVAAAERQPPPRSQLQKPPPEALYAPPASESPLQPTLYDQPAARNPPASESLLQPTSYACASSQVLGDDRPFIYVQQYTAGGV